MNVLLIASVDFPNGDASSAHAGLIVKGFRDNGVNAVLVIPHASRLGNIAGNIRTCGHANGIPYAYSNGRTSRPLGPVKAALDSLRGMCAAAAIVLRRRQHLDAVILATPDSIEFLPVILACILSRTPFFVWSVELMSTVGTGGGWRSNLRMAGHVITERLLPRFASGYIVISTSLVEHYRKYLSGKKLLLAPVFVDGSVQSESTGPRHPPAIVHYGGTFGEKDGVEYIIRAFGVLHDRYPHARLMMTGKNTDDAVMEKLYRLSGELGLTSSIEFKGFLSRAELENIQQNADVLLVCRTKSKFAQHGLPWKLAEYSMTGKPIVATRVGDIELYFVEGEHLLLAEPEDVQSIASKLTLVFNDYDNASEMAQRCREVAIKQLDYCSQMSRVVEFLQQSLMYERKA
jgi:glycosyltransferase involved in cell wall biosynthesis